MRTTAIALGVGGFMMLGMVAPNGAAFLASFAPIHDTYTQEWTAELDGASIRTVDIELSGPALIDRSTVRYPATLRYLDVGKGEPIVLFPPASFSLDYFHKIVGELAKDFRVIAVDPIGHGYSTMPPSVLNEQVLSDSAVAFLDALDLRDVTVSGESSGATNALMAGIRSDRVKRVVALDPYDHAENLDGEGGIQGSLLGKANFFFMDQLGPSALYSSGAPVMGPTMMKSLLSAGVQNPDNMPYHLMAEAVKQGRQEGYRGPQYSLFHERDWFDVPAEYPRMPDDVAVTVSYAEHDWSDVHSRSIVRGLLVGPSSGDGLTYTHGNDAAVMVMGSGHFSALDQPGRVIEVIRGAMDGR